MRLGVNIDHVATLRQARYQKNWESRNREPSLSAAAQAAERGGADGITVHLRQDRRHLQDRDLWELREVVTTKINMELGNSEEIVNIALEVKPEDVCLVPESREEVTTEGGLDCLVGQEGLRKTIERFQEAGIQVSLFIDPDLKQVEAAVALRADAIELHTGAYAEASEEKRPLELARLMAAATFAAEAGGLEIHAGHGLNLENVYGMQSITNCCELNIGHSLVSRALFVGLEDATREMKQLIASW